MSKFAIRVLTLAIYAAPLMVAPMVTPAKAAASRGKHIKKHKRNIYESPGFRRSLVSRSGVACYQAFQSVRRGLPRQRPRHRLQDVAPSNGG